MSIRASFAVLKETVKRFMEDRGLRLAAATAYYAVFSIGPLLVLVVGVAGLVFGEETVRREVSEQIKRSVGEESAATISSMMSAKREGGSLLATVVAGVALVLGASGIIGQLQDALNTIWGVTSKPGNGIWGYVRKRFFSVAMVLGIGFLLLVSMALSTAVIAFSGYLSSVLSMPEWVVLVLNDAAAFMVISLMFALLFKVLPDVIIRWRDVWTGAIGTALLFTAGKFLLGFYLSRQADASAYGAGTAFILILLYLYYSSVILYLGAEFAQAYARQRGAEIRPNEYAVLLTEEQRGEQGIFKPEQENAEQRKAA